MSKKIDRNLIKQIYIYLRHRILLQHIIIIKLHTYLAQRSIEKLSIMMRHDETPYMYLSFIKVSLQYHSKGVKARCTCIVNIFY